MTLAIPSVPGDGLCKQAKSKRAAPATFEFGAPTLSTNFRSR
jgi:hypothetical protein